MLHGCFPLMVSARVINYDLSLVGAAYQEIPLAISYFDWIPFLFRRLFDKRKGKWS